MNYELISSRQNPHVVLLSKLAEKKYRYAEGLFRFDGIKLFSEAAESKIEFKYIFVKESARDKIFAFIEKAQKGEECDFGRILVLEDSLFDRISEEKSPEGIICVAKHIDKLRKIATINYPIL